MKLDEEEKSVAEAINAGMKLIGNRDFPLNQILKDRSYSDEPKIYHYTSAFNTPDENDNDTLAGGVSPSKEIAILKAISEGIERYSLSQQPNEGYLRGSYNQLAQKYGPDNVLNPKEVSAFSEKQLELSNFKNFVFSKDSYFRWIKANSLFSGKEVYIPAQLIYVPYHRHGSQHEPAIRISISTGAANGTALGSSLYRGICEIIERDAYIINYLNSLPRTRIVNFPKDIKKLLDVFSRYNLEVAVLELTLDLQVPVFAALIFDRTGIGPAVSVGVKADLDSKEAIIGAILEANHTRPWARYVMMKPDTITKENSEIESFEDRLLFWSKVPMIDKLSFWQNTQKKNFVALPAYKGHSKIKDLLGKLRDKVKEIYFVDITPKKAKDKGFCVVKVIIPEMQPLYLDERFPYLGGRRLYEVPFRLYLIDKQLKETELNKTPHPFL